MKYYKEYRADYSLCDYSGNLSIHALTEIIQNSVAANFGLMGCDNMTLRTKYDAMWVFVKNYVHINSLVKWDAKFKVECYCIAFKKLKCYIEVDFIDENNNLFAYSVVECCSLDVNSHSLRAFNTIPFPMDYICPIGNEYSFTGKISLDFNHIEDVLVRSQDVDYSRHVNNVSYIRYVLNTYSIDELLSMNITNIEIYYIREVKEKSILSIYKSIQANKHVFSIKNGDTEVFSIHINFDEK